MVVAGMVGEVLVLQTHREEKHNKRLNDLQRLCTNGIIVDDRNQDSQQQSTREIHRCVCFQFGR